MNRKTKKKKAKKTAIKKKQPIDNGKDKKGKFVAGNQAAVGNKNPSASIKREFAVWFKAAVSKKDIVAIARNLIDIAKSKKRTGSIAAAREIMDRCMGKAEQSHQVAGEVTVIHTLMDMIDGTSKGKLPNPKEKRDAGK